MGRLLIMFAAGSVGVGSVCVGTASAQFQGGWEFTFEDEVGTAANPLRPGQATATVTLSATFQVARSPGFASARFSVHAAEPGWGDLELLPVQLPPMPIPPPYPDPLGRTPGVIIGGDITGARVGQLHFPPPLIADPRSPLPVWVGEFTITDFTARTIALSTLTEDFVCHPPPVGEPIRPPVVEGSGVIHVIPAPAGLALLGLGGLAAARRRR